jgi:hypothetical protein
VKHLAIYPCDLGSLDADATIKPLGYITRM